MNLWRRHAQTVRDSSFCYKIDYVTQVQDILNPEEHQNYIIGLKGIAILLNVLNLRVGGVASDKGLRGACIADFFHPLPKLVLEHFNT